MQLNTIFSGFLRLYPRIFLLFIFLTLRSTKSEIFECEFQIKVVEIIGNVYHCEGKVLNSGREQFVENVIGLHVSNRNNNDVKSLHMIHQNMKKFPVNLHEVFPNLERIYVANSNLRSLTAEDLRHFVDLRVLDVWNNKLYSLPGDLFKFTLKIQRVSFAKNPLKRVGEEILDGLASLQVADFRHTHCIDFRAKSALGINDLKKQLATKCFSEVEFANAPLESSEETGTGHIEKITSEIEELRKHFFLQSQTIISMAKEVVEHKETLQSQADNFAGLVSEATGLILQVIEIVVEQGETIDDLEESMEEQDGLIDALRERLVEVERRLGIQQVEK